MGEEKEKLGRVTRAFEPKMRMHNPTHPGEILRKYIGDLSVTNLAAHLGITRVTLSRLLSGSAGVSEVIALKLSEAFEYVA